MEGLFVITQEWMHQHGTSGCGWSNAQLRTIGVRANPRKGWLSRLVGQTITQAQRVAFERGGPLERLHTPNLEPHRVAPPANDVVYFEVVHRRPWQPRCDACRGKLNHPFYWTRAEVPCRTICASCYDTRRARVERWHDAVTGPLELEPLPLE